MAPALTARRPSENAQSSTPRREHRRKTLRNELRAVSRAMKNEF
jgi:hypothetical protein